MLSRAAFVIAAVVFGAAAVAPSAYASPSGGCYTASSGDCVPYPQKGGSQPQAATAQCSDGSWSFSEHPHASGTCHGHGGVQRYL
ncbi:MULTISPECIES: DUF3761 domain-containing protein [unclassified Mycobacterium]|uniref:DUF3761 domain-containing protein n=1 Tax=unclassified Mycobacterium TaxID=2642494 RepID=UPI0012EACB0C